MFHVNSYAITQRLVCSIFQILSGLIYGHISLQKVINSRHLINVTFHKILLITIVFVLIIKVLNFDYYYKLS